MRCTHRLGTSTITSYSRRSGRGPPAARCSGWHSAPNPCCCASPLAGSALAVASAIHPIDPVAGHASRVRRPGLGARRLPVRMLWRGMDAASAPESARSFTCTGPMPLRRTGRTPRNRHGRHALKPRLARNEQTRGLYRNRKKNGPHAETPETRRENHRRREVQPAPFLPFISLCVSASLRELIVFRTRYHGFIAGGFN